MNELITFISQPWHWAVSGSLLAILMVLLLVGGEKFGLSTSYETLCAAGGGGKWAKLFKYNWKEEKWLLLFAGGIIIGGYLASAFLASPEPVQIADSTSQHLMEMGIQVPKTVDEGYGFIPTELFNFKMLGTVPGIILIVGGGFLIGFGSRYAGGCTSGHAISGLSNFQLPSLIAVIGFFIGGLMVSHFILPILLNLNTLFS